MGEYGTYKGEEIKIGTCEDMLYLRPDQIGLVQSSTLRDITSLRFRFPFPDEDNVEPGDFRDPFRKAGVWGVDVPDGVDHSKLQFVAQVGFNVMLPCPLSTAGKACEFKMHANGFGGPVKITQQRVWAGVWATVCECGACGTCYRLPTLGDAQPVIAACVREAKQWDGTLTANWWTTIAERIESGYNTPSDSYPTA